MNHYNYSRGCCILAFIAVVGASCLTKAESQRRRSIHRGQIAVRGRHRDLGSPRAPGLGLGRQNSVSAVTREIERRRREEKPVAEDSADLVEHEGADYLEAYRYYLQQRAYPHDSVDWSFWAKAATHRDNMPVRRNFTSRVTQRFLPGLGPLWQFVGPRNLPPPYRQYYGTQSLSGRINGAAFDPANPRVYYVTAAGGGVWKTFDNGGTWFPLSDVAPWKFQQAGSIALDPKHPSTLYVATNDPFFMGGGQRYVYNGIMRTQDGGTTWGLLNTTGFGNVVVSKIVVDPDYSGLVMAVTGWDDPNTGTTGQIWRSTDNGTHWSPASPTVAHWTDIVYGALNASGNRNYYACAYSVGAGYYLYRSSDHGGHWQPLMPIPMLRRTPQVGIDIAASSIDPLTVYLLSGTDHKVLKSIDGADTWTDLTPNFLTAQYNWSQSTYDYFIGCSIFTNTHGERSDAVYIGLIDVMQSLDGGNNWRSIGGPSYGRKSLIHNDQHAFAVNPNDQNEMLIGNDGGAYHLRYFPIGDTWTIASLNANLGITQFYHLDVHQGLDSIMLGGSQDNATPAATGNLMRWSDVAGGDGGWAAIDQADANTQYATNQNDLPPSSPYVNIFRTTDLWGSNQSIGFGINSPNIPFHSPIMLQPGNSGVLYAGVRGLYRWKAVTQTWQGPLGKILLAGQGAYLTALGSGCAGTTLYTGSLDSNLYRSADGGANWTLIDGNTFVNTITSISVDPSDGNSVLVGLGGTGVGHLWQCADTSAAPPVWTRVTGTGTASIPDVQLNSIARDPSDPKHLWYVGTDVGVMQTVDAGKTWTNATLPLGLPNVQVNELKVALGTGHLYAATFGRGVWRIPLTGKATYSIFDLDPGGVKASYANAINHGMQIAGAVRTSAPAYLGRFWPDQVSSIGWGTLSGGSQSFALGINTAGSVVGYADDFNGTNHAVIWFPSDHKLHNLESQNQGLISQANGINDIGLIVGQRGNNAFIYEPGPLRFNNIGTLGGSSSTATAINNAPTSQIVGYSGTSSGATHAFRLDGIANLTPAQDLGTLGGASSQAMAINDIGQAAGNSAIPSGAVHAFRTAPNARINPRTDDLGTLGGVASQALSIDNMGRVVGKSTTASGDLHAFVWDNANGMQDLNDLIPANSGWTLTEARGIIDCGCIVGIGFLNGKTHGFLLKL